MVMDAALEFSDAQSISGSSAVQSTNVVDMRNGLEDTWGTSKDPDLSNMVCNINVNTAMVGASITVQVDLVTKADTTLTSGATVLGSVTFPAVSASGTKKSIKIATGVETLRYVGLVYTPSGALTSSNFDAYLSLDNEARS